MSLLHFSLDSPLTVIKRVTLAFILLAFAWHVLLVLFIRIPYLFLLYLL
jgi:hypothetical protein